MKSGSRVVAAALALCSFMASMPAAGAEPVTGDSLGRHFILLLDDSGDSPLKPRNVLDPAIPIAELLFAPVGGEPGFDPRRDALSVVFFQVIEHRPPGCSADRPLLSSSPEGMFAQVHPPAEARATAASMATYLRAEFAETVENGGCRFAPRGYSPIERSKRLVLPYLTRHGGARVPVSQIVLIQVSNRKSNPLGDLTHDPQRQFADQEASDELHRQVDDAVSLRFLDWHEPLHRLYIDRYRVTPNVTSGRPSDEVFTVPRLIELRRRAVSADRIRLEAVNGSIRFRSTERLVPVRLTLANETGQSFKTIDVEHCAAPCEVRGDERAVEVVRAIMPAEIPPGTALQPLRVIATSRFRYDMPGVYDGLVVDSGAREIRIQPERPLVVPGARPLWKPLAIDNRVLAAVWRPSDVHGLDQATAARRIAAERATRSTVIVVATFLLVMLAVYLLVSHRGFHPVLDLRAKEGWVDFNAEIPAVIETMEIEVFNSAAAVFDQLQRNPNGAWRLVLREDATATWPEYDHMPARGIEAAALLSLRAHSHPANESRSPGLSGRGDSSVGLVVDGGQLAAIVPPPEWNGGPATLRLSGSLELQHGAKSELYSFSHNLALLPERPAPPHLLPGIAPTVQWTAGEALHLGNAVLASVSQHRFATPTEARYVFQLADEHRVLYVREEAVTVAGKDEVTIRLIAADGTTANPTHVEEQWTVRFDLEGRQPVERQVTVFKDVSTSEAHILLTCGTTADPVEIAWCDGRVHARQQGRTLPVVDDHTVQLTASSGAVQVGRNDSPLVLCTVALRLGKPALGGEITATIRAALNIDRIPVTVRADSGEGGDGSTTLVVTAAGTRSAAVTIAQLDAFDALLMQRRIGQAAMLHLTFDVTIADHGRSIRQQATVRIPQELVRHEHGTILAIDFGNSAVAVATLTPLAGDVEVANLQEIPLLGDRTLAQEDPENAEKGSPLIPSAFAIEFDRRGTTNGGRPGTPWAPPPEVFDGSDPRTISLPALSAHYSTCPERLVQSIKHVIASDYDEMEFDAPIRTQHGMLHTFKVDKLLIGVMRAVAETYAGANLFERLVFTVPNTFLPWQEKRVRTAIEAAFTSAQPEWTRNLSESDAVMHRYLANLPNNDRRELILFYDFGSGTVDLTLTEVKVDDAGTKARILARIGLDRAGAYLDQVLTSIVHRKLENALAATPGAYRFPLLGDSATAGVTNFAAELARAKKQWERGAVLCISQHDERMSIVDPRNWQALSEAGLAAQTQRDGIEVRCIALDWEVIHVDPRIARFFAFVKGALVSECLRTAGKTRQDVTRVIVSGRGALWPGFIDGLAATFPSGAHVAKISNNAEDMKLAVVRGAASWLQKRTAIMIECDAPDPTYLAFTDLDLRAGTWRHVHVLGTEPVVLPNGDLKLAAIPFPYDERTLAAMLQHPLGRRLVRILPFDLPVGDGRQVKAFLARQHGRNTIKIDDGFLTDVVAGGRKWPVGDWSIWNTNQLGTDT